MKLLKSIQELYIQRMNRSFLENNNNYYFIESNEISSIQTVPINYEILQRVFGEIDISAFIDNNWNNNYCYFEKISNLHNYFTWKDINKLLDENKLNFPTFRIIDKNGINVNQYKSIELISLYQILNDGGNLIINAIQELNSTLKDICNELSKLFGNYVSVNAYIAFKEINGFPNHWDDHETIIVQIKGKKYWNITSPTRIAPLREDIHSNEQVGFEVLVDKVISEGDIIYMPRGYWHFVKPINLPSLHLTFSIEPPTALNWIESVIDSELENEQFRSSIPNDNLPKENNFDYERIKSRLATKIRNANLNNFINSHKLLLKRSPKPSLPYAIINFDLNTIQKIQFLGLFFSTSSNIELNEFVVYTLAKKWCFDYKVKDMITYLLIGQEIDLRILLNNFPTVGEENILNLVRELIFTGFIEMKL